MDTQQSGIFGSVQQCTYNENGSKCTAGKIEVGSSKTCCSSCDTECVTLRLAKRKIISKKAQTAVFMS